MDSIWLDQEGPDASPSRVAGDCQLERDQAGSARARAPPTYRIVFQSEQTTRMIRQIAQIQQRCRKQIALILAVKQPSSNSFHFTVCGANSFWLIATRTRTRSVPPAFNLGLWFGSSDWPDGALRPQEREQHRDQAIRKQKMT